MVIDSVNKGKVWGTLAKHGQKPKGTSGDDGDDQSGETSGRVREKWQNSSKLAS